MNGEAMFFPGGENSFFDFAALLDSACAGLQRKQSLYSLRRLREMDVFLDALEKELDALACSFIEKE